MSDAIAGVTAKITERPMTFILPAITLLVLTLWGPTLGFPHRWQLLFNIAVTLLAFVVFVVSVMRRTPNSPVELEKLTPAQLEELQSSLFPAEPLGLPPRRLRVAVSVGSNKPPAIFIE